MKFREHRGLLVDSMETLVELEPTVEALITHLNAIGLNNRYTFAVENMKIKYQGPDPRIKWGETWLVYFEGFGVIGMADCAPVDTPDYVYDGECITKSGVINIRKNISDYSKSVTNAEKIGSNTADLLEHLRKLWGRQLTPDDIRIHKRRSDRRINWAENWAVRVTDHNPTTTLAFIDSLPVDLPHVCIPKLYDKELEATDLVKVTAHSLPQVPEGQSAYQIDLVRSGVVLSAGWEAMLEMSKPVLDEIVLVNSHTGQRVLIKLEAQTHKFE